MPSNLNVHAWFPPCAWKQTPTLHAALAVIERLIDGLNYMPRPSKAHSLKRVALPSDSKQLMRTPPASSPACLPVARGSVQMCPASALILLDGRALPPPLSPAKLLSAWPLSATIPPNGSPPPRAPKRNRDSN